MSNLNNLQDGLPSQTSTFMFEGNGSISKKRYVGEFTAKIPNTKMQCFIDKHRAFLNGPHGKYLDPGTLRIHRQLAHLRYTLVGDLPPFWKNSDFGYELIDHNIIEEVYDKVIEFEEAWVKQVWGEPDESKVEGSAQEA